MMQNATRNAMSPREVVLIRSFRDAKALIYQSGPKLNKQFVFRILRWERTLNKAFHECGCSLGHDAE
jgi:hypothetical protein